MQKRLTPTLLILLVLLAAFALRAYNFNEWPPGLSNDEANNANDALRFARTFTMPLYQLDARPEPLFRFFQALTIATIGPSRFGFRIASLFMGVLSVAAAYRAGRHLTLNPTYARWAGLIAAATLAVMVSHIHLSRVGYRAMPQVLGMLLFLDAFVVGWRAASMRHRMVNFALAGVWLSVALLSYTAGLIMLPIAALGVGHQIIGRSIQRFVQHQAVGFSWRGLLAFAVAFAISITPLILLNIVQPNFYGRAAEVAGGGSESQRTLLEEAQRVIDRSENAWIMFNEFGDINPQYNVDRAPLLPLPIFYFLMLFGVGTCIAYFARLPFILTLAMLLLSLQPVALSNEIPHGLRIMGEFAAIPLVIAAAFAPITWAIRLIPTAPTQQILRSVLALLASGLFIFAGATSFQTYSTYYSSDIRWGDNGELSAFSWFFEMRRFALSEIIADAQQPVYMPLEAVDHSAGRYFTADTHPRIETYATYFVDQPKIDLPPGIILAPPDLTDASTYAVYMPDGTLVLLPRFDEAVTREIEREIEENGQAIIDPFGELAGYQVDWEQPLQVEASPQYAANINYNNQIQLVGWDAPFDVPAGQPVAVTLYFQRTENKQRDVFAFAQLWNWENERIASSSEGNLLRWLYPPDQWAADDVVPYVLRFTTPDDVPPGAYFVAVGLRDHLTQQLPVIGADGAPVADIAIAGGVRSVEPGEVPALVEEPLGMFGDELALIGFEQIVEGDRLIVRLQWQALAQPTGDYTAFVHLSNQDDELLAQSDVQPGGTRYPTSIWRIGEAIVSEHVLQRPAEQAGSFTLYTGLYSFPSLERLPVAGSPDGRYAFGEVELP